MRFAFVEAEKANHCVDRLCHLLEVTRQGFYRHLKRSEPMARVARREAVAKAFEASRGTYGSPRIHQTLQRQGLRIGRRTVEHTMRELNLAARKRRQFRHPKRVDLTVHHPNILNRNFVATQAHEVWVTDITYIHTAMGWVYLAVVLDLFSRSIVGWSLERFSSQDLAIKALKNALNSQRPKNHILHHSDRGCQYTGERYQELLRTAKCTSSMSRRGNCWDNAVAESFFSTLKRELVDRYKWESLEHLRPHIFEYIEVFYNRERLHSTLNYQTPRERLEQQQNIR